MIDPALRKLRLDRRLIDRRGWISPQALQQELDALPDVSAKIAPVEETSEAPEGGPGADTTSAAR